MHALWLNEATIAAKNGGKENRRRESWTRKRFLRTTRLIEDCLLPVMVYNSFIQKSRQAIKHASGKQHWTHEPVFFGKPFSGLRGAYVTHIGTGYDYEAQDA